MADVLHVTDLVLEAHDYDPEGTWWVLKGRGAAVATYSIWSVRVSIADRLTGEERAELEELRPALSEEQVVTRLTYDNWLAAPRDITNADLDDELLDRVREAVR